MTRGKGLAMTREVMLLLKITAKQGIIAESEAKMGKGFVER